MMPRLQLRAAESGNPLGSLYPAHGHYWWPLLEDVFTADPVQKMRQDLLEEALQADELSSVSIDATVRCCLSIVGQASYRAPAAVRGQAAFDDINSKRRVLTLRGRTNAVVGMVPIAEETAELVAAAIANLLSYRARVTVKHVACDNPSAKLFDALTTIFPNLQTMALDAVHLPIVYEYATWRKRTAGSRYLRRIMAKFTKVDPETGAEAWGDNYNGRGAAPLDRAEESMRAKVLDGSMSRARADMVHDALDSQRPFYTRVEFVEALAALSSLFWDEVQRRVTGANKPLYRLLWCAAAPDRLEWLFNNIRQRCRMPAAQLSLLPSGSASNEALHSEINNWFRQTQQIHQATLTLKLDMLAFGKLLTHNLAMYHPTSRQMSYGEVLARALSRKVWTAAAWRAWCKKLHTDSFVQKATLSLHAKKVTQIQVVRDWIRKRPAATKAVAQLSGPKRKRTPFTLQRVGNLIKSRVKNTMCKKPARA